MSLFFDSAAYRSEVKSLMAGMKLGERIGHADQTIDLKIQCLDMHRNSNPIYCPQSQWTSACNHAVKTLNALSRVKIPIQETHIHIIITETESMPFASQCFSTYDSVKKLLASHILAFGGRYG